MRDAHPHTNGDWPCALRCTRSALWVSIGGPATFINAELIREVIASTRTGRQVHRTALICTGCINSCRPHGRRRDRRTAEHQTEGGNDHHSAPLLADPSHLNAPLRDTVGDARDLRTVSLPPPQSGTRRAQPPCVTHVTAHITRAPGSLAASRSPWENPPTRRI